MISSTDILHGKILIVDDQEANILLLKRMLASAGYTSVTSTINPLEVCALHLKNRYDLILLDLQMPHMDGFQVMEGLKEIEPQDMLVDLPLRQQFQAIEGLEEMEPGGYLPVIVITAQPGHKLHALQSGARDFISKPFDLSEVLARVRNMLEVRLLYIETKGYINSLEKKVVESHASRDLIRRQSDEVKRLHDKIKHMETSAMEENEAAALAQLHALHEVQLHTLLYVEDKPDSLELVRQIIARIPDIRLLTAVTGKAGIEMACASLPDVILTDINLHDISGFKILETLRSDPATAHIPVIAISANALPLSIEKGMEAGFFHYLTKPIRVSEFVDALNVALGRPVKSTAAHE